MMHSPVPPQKSNAFSFPFFEQAECNEWFRKTPCILISKQSTPIFALFGLIFTCFAPESAARATIASNNRSFKMTAIVLENPPVPATKPVHLTRARRTAVLKALADPRRFELLERIAKAGCPLGCTEARAALPISAATLSHHIKELETSGLIHVERRGKFHFLTLRPGVLQTLADVLTALDLGSCTDR
jgi:ArsR family transcriptional regulator, arsenate/arsenite/antimonite-responsive transcriptional repressor